MRAGIVDNFLNPVILLNNLNGNIFFKQTLQTLLEDSPSILRKIGLCLMVTSVSI